MGEKELFYTKDGMTIEFTVLAFKGRNKEGEIFQDEIYVGGRMNSAKVQTLPAFQQFVRKCDPEEPVAVDNYAYELQGKDWRTRNATEEEIKQIVADDFPYNYKDDVLHVVSHEGPDQFQVLNGIWQMPEELNRETKAIGMKTHYLQASLITEDINSQIDFLKLKDLYICVEREKKETHVLWRKQNLEEEMKQNGYKLHETSIVLPVEETSFNELDFFLYETERCAVFLFSELAVKADEHGLEIFCRPNISMREVEEYWKEEICPEELSLELECVIPQDELGSLAREIEAIQHTYWELVEQVPGGYIDGEERLEQLISWYEGLCQDQNEEEFLQEEMKNLLDLMFDSIQTAGVQRDMYEFYKKELEQYVQLLVELSSYLLKSKKIMQKMEVYESQATEERKGLQTL